jgi:hypothetical protein
VQFPFFSNRYTLFKKVKEHTVQQAQFLSSNHRLVYPWCIHSLGFSELPVDNVNSQGINASLAVHHCKKFAVAKNANHAA